MVKEWVVNTRWITLVVCVVCFVILGISCLVYTNAVDKKRAEAEDRLRLESERQWCEVYVLYDDYFQANPNAVQTELTKRLAFFFHKRRVELGC